MEDTDKSSRKVEIDTERIIYEVHLRPVLWDKKNKLYKNRDARDVAWLEISRKLVPDYDKLSETERKQIDKRNQQRWRTARDMYKKDKLAEYLSSGPSAKKKKKYLYYDIMTFLDKNPTLVAQHLPPPQLSSPPETPQPSSKTPFKNKQRKDVDLRSALMEYMEKTKETDLELDDLAFFQSLQPNLKNFTSHQKLAFRTKVIQIVLQIETENSNYSTVYLTESR